MITINKLLSEGNLQEERLVLSVQKDCDLGYYMIASTQEMKDGRISASIRDLKWLPDKSLTAGDIVIIYTTSGIDSEETNEAGQKIYKVYWGRERTLDRTNGEKYLLLTLQTWASV